MARPAANSRREIPAQLKLIEGRGNGRDSGGRVVKTPPSFTRIIPQKPEDLSPHAGYMWDKIVDELPRVGLLKELDEFALRVGCETYARWREAVDMRLQSAREAPENRGLLARNSQGLTSAPWIGIEERASREFRAWVAEFGLSPAAEMKLAKDGDANDDLDNPFAGA